MTKTWPIRKLRDVADIRVSNVDKKVYASETPIKLCNYMDVYSNDYVTRSLDFMPGSASKVEMERFGVLRGDVIITKDSETPDDIGVAAVVTDDIPNLLCGYHLCLIRPKNGDVDSVYLAKQLGTSRVVKYFAVNASGSTRFGLPVGAIENLEVPFAPEREQTKIAEILSTVDRGIEQTEALIAKQQRIKNGLMQDLLTRGIDEKGNLRSEETHQFKDSPLGQIPVEWDVETLGAALRRCKGFLQTGPFGSQLHAHEYVHEGVPVIMPQDIIRGEINTISIARITEVKANLLRRHRVQSNDIVFSRRGDLTRASAISTRETGWLCGTGCFLLRVPPDQMNSGWFAHVYRFHVVQRQVDANAVGSTMPSLNNGVMENCRTKTKAAEVEHAIRHHLDVELDDDPDLQASFTEALAAIFEQFRDNWNKIYEELEKLRQRIISSGKEPTYGLHRKKQMPFFRCFQREIFGDSPVDGTAWPAAVAEERGAYDMAEEDRISNLVDLTQQVFLIIERELKLTGFWESIPARNKLKAEIQKVLLSARFSQLPNVVQNRARIISRVMEIAESKHDVILYAE